MLLGKNEERIDEGRPRGIGHPLDIRKGAIGNDLALGPVHRCEKPGDDPDPMITRVTLITKVLQTKSSEIEPKEGKPVKDHIPGPKQRIPNLYESNHTIQEWKNKLEETSQKTEMSTTMENLVEGVGTEVHRERLEARVKHVVKVEDLNASEVLHEHVVKCQRAVTKKPEENHEDHPKHQRNPNTEASQEDHLKLPKNQIEENQENHLKLHREGKIEKELNDQIKILLLITKMLGQLSLLGLLRLKGVELGSHQSRGMQIQEVLDRRLVGLGTRNQMIYTIYLFKKQVEVISPKVLWDEII